jgi:hypothetical protein
MLRRLDDQKVRDWESRLARFGSSGLTVGRFCQKENVSVNRFYYWTKRLGSLGSSVSRSKRARAECVVAQPRRTDAPERSLQQMLPRPAMAAAENTALVHFLLSSGARVSIPADCLDALRCIVQCAQQSSAEHQDGFHQVVVGTR